MQDNLSNNLSAMTPPRRHFQRHLGAAILAPLCLAALPFHAAHAQQQKSVAITAIVEHPALDSVREGVKDGLKAAGFEEGKNLQWQYQSAQGNTGTAAQIARKFVGDQPDVVIGIAGTSGRGGNQNHSGGVFRRHRPGGRQTGEKLGSLGHQRHRRV